MNGRRRAPVPAALRTRFLFETGTAASLADQWAGRREAEGPTLALIRTIPEDPAGAETLGLVWPSLLPRMAKIEAAWAAAELAAGATLIGLALGARVVLVPVDGRWQAELVAIRTRRRVPIGSPTKRPESSLEAARRGLVASLGTAPWP